MNPDAVNGKPIVYRPTIFDLSRVEDRVRLQDLVGTYLHLEVSDTLETQLAELVKSRVPNRKYSLTEMHQAVDKHLDGCRREDYGVQVYYPWSNRLVHLLPEAEFVELRTNRNLYKITPEERLALASKKIGVIGLSVGQSVALTMAMERSFGEIRLADFDTLDLSNLNRIRSGVFNLGLPKVAVTAREIAEIDPFLRVIGFFDGITAANLDMFLLEGGKLDLLIEESDGMDIKFLARYRARELRIPVIMDTSDRGLLDVERFDLEPGRPIFHGLVDEIDPSQLQSLSTEEKVPYVLKILSPETMSARMKASLIEIEQTITTWPQLASNVVLGGALTADVARRILLDQYHQSGRYFVDLETLVSDPNSSIERLAAARITDLTESDIQARIDQALAQGFGREGMEVPIVQIEQIVDAAIQAPSGANNQPWRWVWSNNVLFLFHEPQRSTSFLEYNHFAAYTALGAAVDNAILMAQELQLAIRHTAFPLSGDRLLVSLFTFHSDYPVEERHPYPHFAELIYQRHTNRRIGPRQTIPPAALDAIRGATESVAGAQLHLLTSEDDLLEVEAMLGAVERVRLLHKESHDDMMAEIRWTPAEVEQTRDGVDLETMELSAVDYAGMLVTRDWHVMELIEQWKRGQALMKLVKRSIKAAGAVALITMPQQSPQTYLVGGRAMQRAWLAATEQRIAFQPIAPISYLLTRLTLGSGIGMSNLMLETLIPIKEQYQRLFNIDESSTGILLFRLAIAEEPTKRALRRKLSNVFANRQVETNLTAVPKGHEK